MIPLNVLSVMGKSASMNFLFVVTEVGHQGV